LIFGIDFWVDSYFAAKGDAAFVPDSILRQNRLDGNRTFVLAVVSRVKPWCVVTGCHHLLPAPPIIVSEASNGEG
jgi:hypothetical protein